MLNSPVMAQSLAPTGLPLTRRLSSHGLISAATSTVDTVGQMKASKGLVKLTRFTTKYR